MTNVITRPIDELIHRINDNICVAAMRVPAELDCFNTMPDWVKAADPPFERPSDTNPISRAPAYPIKRPNDDPPTLRLPDNSPLERNC